MGPRAGPGLFHSFPKRTRVLAPHEHGTRAVMSVRGVDAAGTSREYKGKRDKLGHGKTAAVCSQPKTLNRMSPTLAVANESVHRLTQSEQYSATGPPSIIQVQWHSSGVALQRPRQIAHLSSRVNNRRSSHPISHRNHSTQRVTEREITISRNCVTSLARAVASEIL